MLLRKFDFSDKDVENKFQYNRSDYLATWENYYNCYNYVLRKIFHKGFQRNYDFNCRARPLLFLIRHSLELCLKFNLISSNLQVTNNHDLTYLLATLNRHKKVPTGFESIINKMNLTESKGK